jgi:selT/selW/selH-like putative selenoprotein
LAAYIQEKTGVEASLHVGAVGAFEVFVDGVLVFSKLRENRFPATDEILPHVTNK